MGKTSLPVKIVILVLVLFVPGFLYYLLVAEGKNRYKPLPVFGPKSLAATGHKVKGKFIPDTVYHTIPDFRLTDQDNKPVSFKSFNNGIVIVNFFYTGCPGVCKEVNSNIYALDTAYKNNAMVNFLSITVNPQRDNASLLKRYKSQFKDATAKWKFLTGDTATTYNLARNGFLVNALQTGKDDFIYSDKLILVDEDSRIRGYYSGAETNDVIRLNDEIKVLISEELRKNDKSLY